MALANSADILPMDNYVWLMSHLVCINTLMLPRIVKISEDKHATHKQRRGLHTGETPTCIDWHHAQHVTSLHCCGPLRPLAPGHWMTSSRCRCCCRFAFSNCLEQQCRSTAWVAIVALTILTEGQQHGVNGHLIDGKEDLQSRTAHQAGQFQGAARHSMASSSCTASLTAANTRQAAGCHTASLCRRTR